MLFDTRRSRSKPARGVRRRDELTQNATASRPVKHNGIVFDSRGRNQLLTAPIMVLKFAEISAVLISEEIHYVPNIGFTSI